MTRVLRLRAWPRLALFALLCFSWLLMTPGAAAQAVQAGDSAPAPLPSMAQLAVQPASAPGAAGSGRIVVLNREVIALRGSLFGIPAAARAAEGEERIRRALKRAGPIRRIAI